MVKFQSFLFIIAIVIGSNLAVIPYHEVQLNIFDDYHRDFESAIIESTQVVKSFFDRVDVSLVIAGGILVPHIGLFLKLTPLLRNTLVDGGEWRTVFTKAIADETMHAITESEIRWIESSVQTIQIKIKLLSDDNPDFENRKTIASIIHTDLNKMMNLFDRKSSLYRKYPLLGAAPLIQLATLVATFCPIAKLLIPLEAKNPQISCKMHEILLDYLPRTIVSRLHKLIAEESIFEPIVYAMSMPYNQHGYNKTNPGVIDCTKGCINRKFFSELCLRDTHCPGEYYVSNKFTRRCIFDYAAFIRHRIEELFPIEPLNKLCVHRTPQIPTGYGWFTIFLLNAFTYGTENGNSCRLNSYLGCDPYIILYINDEEVLKTPQTTKKFLTNVNKTFTSVKIPKTSKIRLEIWHASSVIWESDALILKSEGDVTSFLNKPIHKGVYLFEDFNTIETMSFWVDEYKF